MILGQGLSCHVIRQERPQPIFNSYSGSSHQSRSILEFQKRANYPKIDLKMFGKTDHFAQMGKLEKGQLVVMISSSLRLVW